MKMETSGGIFLLVILLLLLPTTAFGDDLTLNSTSSPPPSPTPPCTLYCTISPLKDERVDFSMYSSTPCTHLIYGWATLLRRLDMEHASEHDLPRAAYSGNYYRFTRLRHESNSSSSLLFGLRLAGPAALQLQSSHGRERLAVFLVNMTRDELFDGVVLQPAIDFLEHDRFVDFVQALHNISSSTLSSSSSSPLSLSLAVSRSSLLASPTGIAHLLSVSSAISHLVLLSSPPLGRLSPMDPLLTSLSSSAAALSPHQFPSISEVVHTLIGRGFSKKKLVVGLSSATAVYTGFNTLSTGEAADGSLDTLQDVCSQKKGSFRIGGHSASLMVSSADGSTWSTRNNASDDSIGKKVRWITSSGFGGVALQDLQMADPLGECGAGPFPALALIARRLHCSAGGRRPRRPFGCTRFCYLERPRGMQWKTLPSNACSHLVVPLELTPLAEIRLPSSSESLLKDADAWRGRPSARVLLSLGASATNDVWRGALNLPIRRSILAQALKQLATEIAADGVEISWTLSGPELPTDSAALSSFLADVHDAFKGTPLQIAVAVTHSATYQKRYPLASLNETADWLVLHSHRFHSTRQPFTGHHSPLFFDPAIMPDGRNSIEGLVGEWISLGMTREKLLVGVTAEALSMSLLQPSKRAASQSPESPFGDMAKPSLLTLERADPGSTKIISVSQVCEAEKRQDASTKRNFFAKIGVPILMTGNEFVAYDNRRSMQMKTTWASLHRLGGMAIFNLEEDNVNGECPKGQPFPLLNAIINTQMCERCVPPETEGASACSAAFTLACSYRLPTDSEPNTLDPHLVPFEQCTEVVVEDALLKPDFTVSFRDATATRAMAELHRQLPRLGMRRLVASVRCDMDKQRFDEMLKSHQTRMVDAVLSLVASNGFSGVELSCDHVVRSDNSRGFALLLNALRQTLAQATAPGKCLRTLSLRMPIWRRDLSAIYDIPLLNELQHVVLEPFDDPIQRDRSHLNSPLFSPEDNGTDVVSTVQSWLSAGLDHQRILLQIPTYGKSQKLEVAANETAIGVPTSDDRIITQAELCSALSPSSTTKHMEWDRIAAYAIVGEGSRWISMENPQTIAYKVFFAVREGLGGVGLLSLNEDDWSGSCKSGTFPLLHTAFARCPAVDTA